MMPRSSISPTETVVANGAHPYAARAQNSYVPEALYWEKYYTDADINYEWNNGQLEVVPVTDHAKYLMYLWFLDVLRDFLHVQPVAKIIGLEMGFRLALPTKTTIRKPDLGLVLHTNSVPLDDHDRSYHGVFDLCVESLSDSTQAEIDRDTIIKRAEYAAAGVQEYYILDERGIETQFYHLTRRGVYQPMPRTNGLIRSQVLPGFQFRIQDLYTKPAPPQIVQDPVYNSFISPFYRAERLRAEEAEARAEQEHQRAEHYAALLQAAGLLPPQP
ncbi:MAG: Uma2 family endonuclease [Caldilineaceae bacterium]